MNLANVSRQFFRWSRHVKVGTRNIYNRYIKSDNCRRPARRRPSRIGRIARGGPLARMLRTAMTRKFLFLVFLLISSNLIWVAEAASFGSGGGAPFTYDSDEYGNSVFEDLEEDDYECPPCSYEMRSVEAESGSVFPSYDFSKGVSSEEDDGLNSGGYIKVKIPLFKPSGLGLEHKIELGADIPEVKKINFDFFYHGMVPATPEKTPEAVTTEITHPIITLMNRMKYTFIPATTVDVARTGDDETGDVQMFESKLTLVMSKGKASPPSASESTAPAEPSKEAEFPAENAHAHVKLDNNNVKITSPGESQMFDDLETDDDDIEWLGDYFTDGDWDSWEKFPEIVPIDTIPVSTEDQAATVVYEMFPEIGSLDMETITEATEDQSSVVAGPDPQGIWSVLGEDDEPFAKIPVSVKFEDNNENN